MAVHDLYSLMAVKIETSHGQLLQRWGLLYSNQNDERQRSFARGSSVKDRQQRWSNVKWILLVTAMVFNSFTAIRVLSSVHIQPVFLLNISVIFNVRLDLSLHAVGRRGLRSSKHQTVFSWSMYSHLYKMTTRLSNHTNHNITDMVAQAHPQCPAFHYNWITVIQ